MRIGKGLVGGVEMMSLRYLWRDRGGFNLRFFGFVGFNVRFERENVDGVVLGCRRRLGCFFRG